MNGKDANQLNDYLDDPERNAAPDAATEQVVGHLRQQAEQVEPRPQFVQELSSRLQAEARQTNTPRSLGDWLVLRFVPRVVGVTAVVGLIALVVWGAPKLWQQWANPETEPVLSGDAIPVTARDTTSANPFPDAPAELPLHQIEFAPLPTTPEEAVAWAADFGLPDPQAFTDPRLPGQFQVFGSNNESLTFHMYGPDSVYYSTNQGTAYGLEIDVTKEPLPFATAADIAIEFLVAHNLLPTQYQVVEGRDSGHNGMRVVSVLPEPTPGYPLTSYGEPVINLRIGPEGDVLFGNFARASFAPGQAVSILSAQEAYEAYQSGELSSFMMETIASGPMSPVESFSPPPPVYQVGDEVEVKGWPNVLVAADGDDVRAMLYGNSTAGVYHLVGEKAKELAGLEMMAGELIVRGVITAAPGPNEWEISLTDWEEGRPAYSSYAPFTCLKGTFSRETDGYWLTTDENERYQLPDAPVKLNDGDRIEACMEAAPEAGEAMVWQNITRPPASEAPMSEGGVSMMTTAVEVERQVDIPTPLPITGTMGNMVVVETVVSGGGGGSGGSGTVISSGGLHLAPNSPEATLAEQYAIGESATLTGMVDALIFEEADGSQRYQISLQLLDERGLMNGSVPLTAVPEVLTELAAYHGRFLRVSGVMETADEWPGLALAVAAHTAVYPEATLQNFLGHIELEMVEGVETAVFVDHATDTRYLVAQRAGVYGEFDYLKDQPQILLVGIISPDKTVAGLPVLIMRSTSFDTRIAQAEDVSEFPLETKAQIIPYSRFQDPLTMAENMVLERMELVYYYEPVYDHTAVSSNSNIATSPPLADEQTARPVWLLHSRSPDGSVRYKIYIEATE
ncbi:MAG: hypothetical protein KJ069_05105 [Anaerolineae bacterium]|nr:hypothetical protein [Anaerolineae bacterium]